MSASRPPLSLALRRHLDLAFVLAERGRIGTPPNPMVGAVVLQDGRIVGTGWHRQAGGPHAEVLALDEAGSQAIGGTLVTTLEPCCHAGKTGPCVDRILAAGIRNVVSAGTDPNPAVSGEGFRRLEAAGLSVTRDADPERDALLNERFHRWIVSGHPFVNLKMATSFDGRAATPSGQSKWITREGARARVQLLREEYDALAIGIGTVLSDDPRLSRRIGWRTDRPLVRVIFDRTLRLPLHARLFDDPSPVLVVTIDPPEEEAVRRLALKGAEVLAVPEGVGGLAQALTELGGRGISGLLVEGGPTLAASFLEAGLVDRWTGFLGPLLVGGERAPGPVGGEGVASLELARRLKNVGVERIGDDWMLSGRL